MKRIIALSLALLFALSAAPMALAAKKTKKKEEEPEQPKVIPAYEMIIGSIVSIDKKNNRIEIQPEEGGSVQLLFGGQLRIVDNEKKSAVDINKLKVGTEVRAWHGTAMTASIPPQAVGYAMLTNLQPGSVAGEYFEVEWVGKSGSEYTLLNQPKTVYLSMAGGLKLKGYNKNAATRVSGMIPGARFLYWPENAPADAQDGAEETAAQAAPAKESTKTITMFPYVYDGYIIMEQNYLNVNGYMLDHQAIADEEGALYIPLADAAMRLGFSRAAYSSGTRTATLKKGNKTYTFVADAPSYTVGNTTVECPAPKVEGDVLYVALETILSFGNYKMVMN